ncbi:NAD(P)-dependent oxidoreductase [Streptomyces sp. TP-A0356]|uniref:NAD-dependent epimerase/dehydratase family protein n=1 Tax=Streptomyces sp. TP-A0356 TaxID=1359208 RepID=UPI0007C6BBF4|nr:NAD(P)-dependent oxidoreductase [Streptomyces sp. TP-A0356]
MVVGAAEEQGGGQDETPSRVVILGATGFVGRHVGAAFQAGGHQVLAVARRPAKIPASWRFFPADLANDGRDELLRLMDAERPVAIVNAAGAAWSSSEGPLREGNLLLVEQVLAALDAASCRPRLVHLGSMHEYEPQPVGTALDERVPTRPVTAYGASKLLGSRAVLEAAASGRADAVVLRLSNVIGTGTPTTSLLGSVAQQLRKAAQTREPAVVRLSPLRASRDFVDARDTADAIVAAALGPVGGQVINIGRGEATHVRVLVDLLIAASGMTVQVVENPGSAPRPSADPDWMRVDISAARELLGWSPRRGLEDAVRELWETTTPG